MIADLIKRTARPAVMKLRRLGWILRGRPEGDGFSFAKQGRIIALGRRFGCSTLVETGTLFGDTVDATRRHFEMVMSIELSDELHRRATRRFRGIHNVRLLRGDSASEMPVAVAAVKGRALFWLDGHYSGPGTAKGDLECPIVGELNAIGQAARKDHCILIDDARCFGTLPDYPAISELREMLLRINPDYQITVENDTIFALPPNA